MFAGLRLDGGICRDDQQHQVDAAYSGQHVADKTLMPGDIDKAQLEQGTVRRSQLQVRESEVNRDAAALLFFQPVGVDAGQGANQGRLAVVNMPRSTDDHRFHGHQCS